MLSVGAMTIKHLNSGFLFFTSSSKAFTLLKSTLVFPLHQLTEVGPGGKCVPEVKCADHLTEALTLRNSKGLLSLAIMPRMLSQSLTAMWGMNTVCAFLQ